MTTPGRLLPQRESLALLVGGAGLVWLLRHPYFGIQHDATIYALLAARWLEPAAYARDPAFLYGAQDAFSLFTPVFGILAGSLGLAEAARLIVIAGGLSWVGAVVLLARNTLGDGYAARFAALAGAWMMFSYSPESSTYLVTENFATARILAQPLALVAIAVAIAGGSTALAWGAALAATALHPLMGIWAAGLLLAQRLPLGIVATLPLWAGVLLIAGASPLAPPALRPIDPQWLEALHSGTLDVVVPAAAGFRTGELLFWIAALACGARFADPARRRWYASAAILAATGLGLAVASSLCQPLALVVQAQPWRVMWLAIVLGALALVDALASAPPAGRYWGAWLAALSLAVPQAAWLVLLASSALPWSWSGAALRPLVLRVDGWRASNPRLAWALPVLAALPAVPGALQAIAMSGQESLAYPWFEGSPLLRGLILFGGGGLGLAVLAGLAGVAKWRRPLLVGVGLALVVVGSRWDHRSPAVRADESRWLQGGERPFGGRIPPGEVVAWPDGELSAWFELRAANHAYWVQAVGGVFSYDKLREVRRRTAALRAAVCRPPLPTGEPPLERQLCPAGLHRPDAAALGRLCADPQLDWLVLPAGLPAAGVPLPAPEAVDGRGQRFVLFECRRYRAGSAFGANASGIR